jgi:hypothetical protein
MVRRVPDLIYLVLLYKKEFTRFDNYSPRDTPVEATGAYGA